jgi:non-homologous end joining protein Ku
VSSALRLIIFEPKEMLREKYTVLKDDLRGKNQIHTLDYHFTARRNYAVVNVLSGGIYMLTAAQA